MKLTKRYLIAWLLWGAMFFAIEIPASINRSRGDTLSEMVWQILGTFNPGTPLTPAVRLRRIAVMGFFAWLISHFFFQFA